MEYGCVIIIILTFLHYQPLNGRTRVFADGGDPDDLPNGKEEKNNQVESLLWV